jgi:hypothetical protein
MASSRKMPSSYNTKSYDSAGGKDYSSFATWESATDNDLVSASKGEVLEVYAGNHDDALYNCAGATCNSSYFRLVKPATGAKHSGIFVTSGVARFVISSGGWACFDIREDYSRVEDLIIELTERGETSCGVCRFMGATEQAAYVGILLKGSSETSVHGFQNYSRDAGDVSLTINCIAINCANGWVAGSEDILAYNCNAVSNTNGFIRSAGTATAKNCCSSSNSADWWGQTTCTAEDATPTYVASGSGNYHLASNDSVCMNNGTDLSSDEDYPFDDDIDGETRSGSWDIGFDEYVAAGGISIPVVMHHRLRH